MTILNSEQTQNMEQKEISSAPETIIQQQNENINKVQEENKTTDTNEDPNWRAFREARKKDRAEREAAEKKALEKEKENAALKAAMEAAFSKSSPSVQAYQQYYGINQDYLNEETEEQKIERKVNELLQRKEEQYKKEQAEYEMREYPNRLKKDFPDFNHICSPENLDYLDYHYPEVSRPLQRLTEGYDKWHDIYHAVKKFIPNQSDVKKESLRADINNLKPKSISSPTISPQGEKSLESWQEIEQRRAANWQRMTKIMKSA
ncbi:MAG: hypothetical protein ABFD00_10385 [Chloroherpetonaceae bacterium]